ncbi:MAG: HVO_0476 family zinc finger protein [Halobacteriaceae archaeon]
MSESAERVAVPCPSCSPEFETVHEVLTTGGGHATVRCTECGHVHKERVPSETTVERDVVVSQDGESFSATVEAPPGETVARGEEFVLETEEAIFEVRITDLQLGPERHVDEATVEDVDTLFTRVVGNVRVNVTVNPSDGRRDRSRGLTVYVPGDYEFEVGETETFGDETFTVSHLHLRDDAVGYDADKLDRAGDLAQAKDLKRVYGRDEGTDTWRSPWT